MPNTIPANGEAMPAANRSRRRFFLAAGNVAAVAAVTSALARTGRTASPPAIEPVLPALEEHRRAFAYANEKGTSEEETGRRVDIEDEVLWRLAQTEPTTLAGARLLLDYIADYDNGCMLTAEMHCIAMKTVASALAKMEGANV